VANGAVYCWGQNDSGQLGSKTLYYSETPIQVPNLWTNATAVGVGSYHSCAIQRRSVVCWGANGSRQVNKRTPDQIASVVTVEDVSDATSVVGGASHTCAITNGAAKCWGVSNYGQLGTGEISAMASGPVQVLGLENGVTSISSGENHVCAIVNDQLKCWGDNSLGQLGNAKAPSLALSPSAVYGLSGVTWSVAGGPDFSCFSFNQQVYCAGSNAHGKLGLDVAIADSSSVPLLVRF
jgi:alpha-tubulin suppressor-like RCC1 family protein